MKRLMAPRVACFLILAFILLTATLQIVASWGSGEYQIKSMLSLDDENIGAEPNLSWSKTFGGTEGERAYSVIQTSDGGYALAGFTTSYGTYSYDFWLIKTDNSGNEEWSRTFDGGIDFAHSVIQTSDGGYVLTGASGGVSISEGTLLVKTDSSGNEEWSNKLGGFYDHANSVIQTSDGGYALAATTGELDLWLVKTDNSGNIEWGGTFGGENWDTAGSVIQTSDGGYALAGATFSYGAGHLDFWLIKTDNSGNEEWSKTFGSTNWDEACSVIQTSDGGYALAGITYSYGAGGGDFWLVKTDSSGNMEWNKTFGGENGEEAYSVIQTSDGGYVLAGYTESYGGEDFWLVKVGGTIGPHPEEHATSDNDNEVSDNENLPASTDIPASTGGTVSYNFTEFGFTLNILEIPPNSLSENTTITVEEKSVEAPPGYAKVSQVYDIGPDNTTFSTPSTLTLPYDENEIPEGASEEDLVIYRRTGDNWERVGGTVDNVANTVSVQIDHLSEYAVMAQLPTQPPVVPSGPAAELPWIIIAVASAAVVALIATIWGYLSARGKGVQER